LDGDGGKSFEFEKISQTYLKRWETVERYGIVIFPTVPHTLLMEAHWNNFQ